MIHLHTAKQAYLEEVNPELLLARLWKSGLAFRIIVIAEKPPLKG